ncbi:hypothetical protein GW17_00038558 [Ensete ventricosum]|uniref:Uncharacterized protein n=1 Tax=Ensete ventricosum TaxID=4639 RepID=A0A444DKF5_ENSVE|nr:hypothetical protein GW17_00038558 [Ensete ventricosum]RZR74775.1 hypothetical protein BHM03_00042946 [Ensete ventricosum]
MGRRILNDALRTIVNAEKRGKATANLQPISTVMVSFLDIMKIRGTLCPFCDMWYLTLDCLSKSSLTSILKPSAHRWTDGNETRTRKGIT